MGSRSRNVKELFEGYSFNILFLYYVLNVDFSLNKSQRDYISNIACPLRLKMCPVKDKLRIELKFKVNLFIVLS